MSGTVTALLDLHRLSALLHKFAVQLGFVRTYPRPDRAKNGVFSIGALPTPPQARNVAGFEAVFAFRFAPKRMIASRQAVMLV